MSYEKRHKEKTPRTLDSYPRSSRQATISDILQAYKNVDKLNINFETFSRNSSVITQLKRERIQEDEESIENHSYLSMQRVIDEHIPMNTKIRIDFEGASDYGDTGIIRRPSKVKPNCMAVEFDNETGVFYRVYFHEMSVKETEMTDPLYPELMFTIDHELSKIYGDKVYYVTGKGLENITKVMREGKIYYDMDGKRWRPKIAGEELDRKLVNMLNEIAKNKYGERCHEVAEEMQDQFNNYGLQSVVYEIYTEAVPKEGNYIQIMGARVRNHYVNILNNRVYDSSTGGNGILWDEYLAAIQKDNMDRPLLSKIAKPS